MTTPVKTGTEFQVNTNASSDQQDPSITALSDGGFVVTWMSDGQDGDGYGIYGQRYDASGAASGSEFKINTFVANEQWAPSVTALSDGGFVVTWMSNGQDGSGFGIYGQRYNANGTNAGGEFLVNTYTTNSQGRTSITGLDSGGFVVTWHSWGQDGSNYGVYGQRYDATGATVSTEFLINTYTADNESTPSVTALSDGGFVVIWSSNGQDGSGYGVYGQRYDASGAVDGAEFQINSYTTYDQYNSSVTGLESGGFVVTWASYGQDDSGWGVYGQRYNANGTTAGSEFQVNTYTTNDQHIPSVTALADGGFVVTWMSDGQDGSGYGIYGQRYDATGAAAGNEFLINTYTTGDQSFPSVTALEDGGFVVTMQSLNYDGSGWGVVGQIFSYASADFTAGDDSVTLYGPGQSVDGLAGADTITGADYATGSDIINGGAGDDIINGMAGDDTIEGGADDDALDGGDDTDTASYASAGAGVTVSLALQGSAQNTLGAGNDTLSNFENLTGSGFADTLSGDANANRIEGGAGNDILDGGAGDDILVGGTDTDTASYASAASGISVSLLLQGISQDTLAAGLDILANIENLSGSAFADTLKGDNNANQLDGGAGKDKLFGNGGNDKLYGDAGKDRLEGGGQNDRLHGGDGKDKLFGDKGNDKLYGGDANDRLFGGKGSDKLTGGAGKDQFVFAKKEGKDTITDFENGKDKIDLSAFSFASKTAALAKFYEIGSATNDKMGFKYKGTEIIIKGIDMGDLNGADIII